MKVSLQTILEGLRLAQVAIEAWKANGTETVEITPEMLDQVKVDPDALAKRLKLEE